MVGIRKGENAQPETPMDAEAALARVDNLAEELQHLGFRSRDGSGSLGAAVGLSATNGASTRSPASASLGANGAHDGATHTEEEQLNSDDEDTLPFGQVDPLYDEHADTEDEEWVCEELLGGCGAHDVTPSVSCPSCFALLSMQVQQHVQYEGQFRAVSVTNCKVIDRERLQITTDKVGRRPKKGEVFKPVVCRKCDTEVAVLDVDEVYHFCNVIY